MKKDTVMILALLLLGIAATFAANGDIFDDCPTCVLFNTTCYNVSYLLELPAPFRKRVVIPKMALLRSNKTLFFSFEPVIEDKEYYKTGFLNLDVDSPLGIISDGQVLNIGAFDIDQDNNLIYFGGNDGIFVLNANTYQVSSYSSRGDTITNVFYKNKVYFTRYNEKGIIVKNGDNFRTMFENDFVKNFVVTKNDVYIFLINTGLYVGKGEKSYKISKNAFFRGITIDLDGVVYTWWVDGIYKVLLDRNLPHTKLVRVAKVPNIGAMTFDNDNNILFTSDKSLYIMKETIASGCGIVPE